MLMAKTFRHTARACYTGYISQAIVNNLAPLLFALFRERYGLTFEEVGRLTLVNFLVQIAADILSIEFVRRFGYRAAAVAAHVFCAAGLILMGILPRFLDEPYLGLILSVVLYALGGGVIEVIVSPIVDSLPGTEKASAMSLLHSFYSWGQVGVTVVTTLALHAVGGEMWPLLPIVWAAVPLYNLGRFLQVPLAEPVPGQKMMTLGELLRSRLFLVALLLMLCAGAAEQTMSQWSSLFAERGLNLPKVWGDLLGPCCFAMFMGVGRALYGAYGGRIHIKRALAWSSALCIGCYLIAVFAPWPPLSLAGCALCGLSVSLMWPGTFSMASARFPRGGVTLFGAFAVLGDLGCSAGPWLAGLAADRAGLRGGLLIGTVFPALLLAGVLVYQFSNAAEAGDPPRPPGHPRE